MSVDIRQNDSAANGRIIVRRSDDSIRPENLPQMGETVVPPPIANKSSIQSSGAKDAAEALHKDTTNNCAPNQDTEQPLRILNLEGNKLPRNLVDNAKFPPLIETGFQFSNELRESSPELYKTVEKDFNDPDSLWHEEDFDRSEELYSSRFLLNAVARNIKGFQLGRLDPRAVVRLQEESQTNSPPSEELINLIQISYEDCVNKIVLGGTSDVAEYFRPKPIVNMDQTIIRSAEDRWLDTLEDIDLSLEDEKRKSLLEKKTGQSFTKQTWAELKEQYQRRAIKKINELLVPKSVRSYLEEKEGRPLSDEEILTIIETNEEKTSHREFQAIAEILLSTFRNPANSQLIESLIQFTYDNETAQSLPQPVTTADIGSTVRSELMKIQEEQKRQKKKTLAVIAGSGLVAALGWFGYSASKEPETHSVSIVQPADPAREVAVNIAKPKMPPQVVKPTTPIAIEKTATANDDLLIESEEIRKQIVKLMNETANGYIARYSPQTFETLTKRCSKTIDELRNKTTIDLGPQIVLMDYSDYTKTADGRTVLASNQHKTNIELFKSKCKEIGIKDIDLAVRQFELRLKKGSNIVIGIVDFENQRPIFFLDLFRLSKLLVAANKIEPQGRTTAASDRTKFYTNMRVGILLDLVAETSLLNNLLTQATQEGTAAETVIEKYYSSDFFTADRKEALREVMPEIKRLAGELEHEL